MRFFIILRFLGLASCFGLMACRPGNTSEHDSDSHLGGKWQFDGIAEIRAYRINWDEKYSVDTIIGPEGELNESRLPRAGTVLSKMQMDKLEAAVTGTHPGHPVAMCFYPHHAFLFFDDGGAVVGHIDICFQCSYYDGAPEGFADHWDLDALESLIKEIGMPIRNEEWD